MSKFTKIRIMDVFLSILSKKSLDKITVKDVIETAEVNRNTFYYYFDDIYDLLDQVLKKEFDQFGEGIEEASFYDAYVKAAEFIMNNRQAISHIYHSKDRELLTIYMEKVTKRFVKYFVKEAAKVYSLSEDGISYLTEFYSGAIIGNTRNWIQEGMPAYRENYLFLVSKSFEDSIDIMIQSYLENSGS